MRVRTTVLIFASLTAPACRAQGPAGPATPGVYTAQVAKIGLLNFEQLVMATNEGQTAVAKVKEAAAGAKAQVDGMASELASLKKQLAAAPDNQRQLLSQTIEMKQNELNKAADAASTQYNIALQQALGKVAQKVAVVARTYAKANGLTMVLDTSTSTSQVFWANEGLDISQPVLAAYNKQSGVPAPK